MKITFYLFIYFFEMRKTTTKKEKDFSDCVVRHERGTKKLDGGGIDLRAERIDSDR